MFDVTIERWLNRSIDEVFECISDHENYRQFKGVTNSLLLEEGAEHRNGVGALRQIDSGKLSLRERITVFEPPVQMSYLIESAKPLAIHHEIGEIRLLAENAGTRVIWRSRGRFDVPLIGPLLLDRLASSQIERQFSSILKQIEQGRA